MKWRIQPPARKVREAGRRFRKERDVPYGQDEAAVGTPCGAPPPAGPHDHRYGACDLPPHPTGEDSDTRCRWEHPGALLFGRTCCAGCTVRSCVKERQQMGRAANRKERYAGRREARRGAADPA